MGIVLGIVHQTFFQIYYSALPIICVPELVTKQKNPDKTQYFRIMRLFSLALMSYHLILDSKFEIPSSLLMRVFACFCIFAV